MLDLRQDHVVSARVATPRPLGARVRLAEAAARGLHPDGLASEAILVLRRVTVAWRVDVTDPRELRAAVAERLTRAGRPGRGATGDEEAVLFDSLEELLACLARDGVAGRRPWWWGTLGLEPTAFAARWVQSPEALPGVIRRLAEAGALTEVARQISAREATELLRAVVRQASLTELASAVERIPAARAVLPPDVRPASPWGSPVAAVVPGPLPPPVEAFVGLAATLASAPERARRPELAAKVTRWAAEVAGEAPVSSRVPAPTLAPAAVPNAPPEPGVTTLASQPTSSPPAGGDLRPGLVPGRPAVAGSAAVEGAVAPVRSAAETPARGVGGPHPSHAGPSPVRPDPEEVVPLPSRPAVGEAGAPSLSEAPALEAPPPRWPAPPEPEATWVVPAGFPTALGGAFYLVNVLLALDLYGDFTQPARVEPEVPLWDVVAATAAALLPEPPADALWAFLARLGGRRPHVERPAGEPPLPGDFAPPGDGWVVSRPLPAAFPRPADLSTEAWLDAVVAGVRTRLTTAIDLPPEAWLLQSARVRDHDHHLEVLFRLSTHPVEVRLAGLDRDPGWVPAAGRDLRFRYDG